MDYALSCSEERWALQEIISDCRLPAALESIEHLLPVVNTVKLSSTLKKEPGRIPKTWVQILPQTLTIHNFSITRFSTPVIHIWRRWEWGSGQGTCEAEVRGCVRPQPSLCPVQCYPLVILNILALDRHSRSHLESVSVCCSMLKLFDPWMNHLLISQGLGLFSVAILKY